MGGGGLFLNWKILQAGCISKAHTKEVLNVLLRVSWVGVREEEGGEKGGSPVPLIPVTRW